MAARAPQSGALPFIRCSDCGVETEMSMMGGHVCRKQTMSPVPPGRVNTPPALRANSPLNRPGLGISANPLSQSQLIPRIQTQAMVRPLVMPNELTPSSSGHTSHATSPKSATSGFRSPFRLPPRGMTLPLIPRPLSPELTNLDCAFPPFPTKPSRSTTPVSNMNSQNSDGEHIYERIHAEHKNTSSTHRPASRHNTSSTSGASPNMASSPMRRNRSATVGASQAVVFEPTKERRPSLTSLSESPTRQVSVVPPLPSPPISIQSGKESPQLPKSASPVASGRSVRADTIQSIPGPVHPYVISSAGGSAQNERTGLINQDSRVTLEPRQSPSSTAISSSSTLPNLPPDLHSLPTSLPPQQQSYRAKRPPPISSELAKSLEISDLSPTKTGHSLSRSPTFPFCNTDRVTSTGPSSFLQRRPFEPAQPPPVLDLMPTGTADEKQGSNQPPSIITKFAERIISEHSGSASPSSDNTNRSTMQTVSSQSSFYPEDVAEKPATNDTNVIPATFDFDLRPPEPINIDHQLDSPTDPLFQQGRLTPIPDSKLLPSTRRNETKQPAVPSPPILPNKGLCKGCSVPIAAGSKSVSSADGRLSGRYHKSCFVCTTCHAPFATADFYILADAPYCAPHYHTLNGSLCGACGRGIEGEYHAATRYPAKGEEKFHARCFTCTLCRGRLQRDYFEHDGRFFCEKDIHRVVRPAGQKPNMRFERGSGLHSRGVGSRGYHTGHPPPRGRIPDRRTTKLMIMS